MRQARAYPKYGSAGPLTPVGSGSRRPLAAPAGGALVARRVFLGQASLPRRLTWAALGWMAAVERAIGGVAPASPASCRWLAAANKTTAYRGFASAAGLLDRRDRESIAAVPGKIVKLGSYAAVWSMEGASYYQACRYHGFPRTAVGCIPPSSWITLHSGAGLAWAERAFQDLCLPDIRSWWDQFWRFCCREACDGYEEIAFEALGLVAATLYPHLVPRIAESQNYSADARIDLFWHGIGRGLYFLPAGFLPWRSARNLASTLADRWTATPSARANVWAGVAWALTLVNIRHPNVIQEWLTENAHDAGRHEALRHGITSALIVWLTANPGDPYVKQFGDLVAHSPGASSPGWNNVAVPAWRQALKLGSGGGHPLLATRVFRVQPLPY